MIWVDIAILVIIGISAIISVLRGFVKEVLSLAAWILAFWVAMTFTPNLAVFFESSISVPSVRLSAAFLVLFVGTLVLGGLVNLLISKLVKATELTGTDRALGILFGIARGGAIIVILVLLAGLTPLPRDPWWQESMFIGHFQSLAVSVQGYLPENAATHFSYAVEPL